MKTLLLTFAAVATITASAAQSIHFIADFEGVNSFKNIPVTLNVSSYGDIDFSDRSYDYIENSLAKYPDKFAIFRPEPWHTVILKFKGDFVKDVSLKVGDETFQGFHWDNHPSFNNSKLFSIHLPADLEFDSAQLCFIPEPSTVLLGLAGLPLLLRRRR